MQLQYRYDTTAGALIELESTSPIIRAAYAIAKNAHAPQSRGKADDRIPYIVHPMMVYDLLVAHGETDEITLAAALLHDAKEDCKDYVIDPSLMRQQLAAQLAQEGVVDAKAIAGKIDEVCSELTNAPTMNEGKRAWQVGHADKLSGRAALLKILDQMASVLDGIMVEDSPQFLADNKRGWNYKALDVVKSAAGDRSSLQYWKNLFKTVFSYQMEMIDHPEKEADMRAAFAFDKACDHARNYPAATPDITPAQTVTRRDINATHMGCISVSLSDTGDVTGYTTLTNPQGDRHHSVNKCHIELCGELEKTSSKRRVTITDTAIDQGRLVRAHKVKPPIDLATFTAAAKATQAIGEAFAQDLRSNAAQLTAAQGEGRV